MTTSHPLLDVIADQRAEIDKLRAELNLLCDTQAEDDVLLAKELDDKDTTISDLRDEVDHWRDQASTLAAERDSLKEENSGLRASLSAAMQCIEAATSEVVRLERKQKRARRAA